MSDTEVSVILPNLNGAKYLERALVSFLEQGQNDCELIVVDAKSTDGSHEILTRYTDDQRIRWLRESDVGISDAVNKGVGASRGGIIGYLGSDDLLYAGILETVKYFSRIMDWDGLFFNSYTHFVSERRVILQKPRTQAIDVENLLAFGTIVGLQNIFLKKAELIDFPLNVQNRTAMDYELLFELAAAGRSLAYVDQPATINFFDGNITHSDAGQALEAAHAARRFMPNGYRGRWVGEELLPLELRRPTPSLPRRVVMSARSLGRRVLGLPAPESW